MSINKKFIIRYNKKNMYCFFVLIIFWVLMAGNSKNPDLENYYYGYIRFKEISPENLIYSYMIVFFRTIGVKFEIFRMFLCAIGLANIYISMKKIKCNTVLLYVLYFVSLFMMDTTQICNYLAMSFVMLGFSLYTTIDKHKKKVFFLFVLVAVGFHASFVFYIPFIIFCEMFDAKYAKQIFISILCIMIIVTNSGFATAIIPFINSFLSKTDLSSYTEYLQHSTILGHWIPIMLHVLMSGASYYFYIVMKKNNNKRIDYPLYVLLFNVYGIFSFPLFRIQMTLSRLTRNLVLLTFSSGIYVIKRNNYKNKKYIIIIMLVVLAIIQGYFTVYSEYMDNIVVPFFRNNWILFKN